MECSSPALNKDSFYKNAKQLRSNKNIFGLRFLPMHFENEVELGVLQSSNK